MSSSKSLFWFRRDLRLSDNRALFEACKNSDAVIPVFVFDTTILNKLNTDKDKRVTFIFDCLMEINESLKKYNSKLLIAHGDPRELIPMIAKENNVNSVYCNEDYEPNAKKRDLKVARELAQENIDFMTFKDQVIFRGNEVLKKDGTPYRVFTPYKNEWLKRVSDDDLKKYTPALTSLVSKFKYSGIQVKSLHDIGFKEDKGLFIAGEKEAKKHFSSFLKRIDAYKDERDLYRLNTNSNLSVYLRFGCISVRDIAREISLLDSEGVRVWYSEIIWREFYQMILEMFPKVEKHAFIDKYDDIQWPGESAHFKAWKDGMTGFPVIDATMRYFKETGIIHNRLRMVVASFLVKDLLIDWRKGEKYFAELLLDYDMASNNGGWQWCASTGCDAQPYFRIFNPISQSKKFDPEGEFLKKYLPELANYPKKYIHYPSDAPIDIQKEASCVVGKDYPKPIVDHSTQRLRAIDLFKVM